MRHNRRQQEVGAHDARERQRCRRENRIRVIELSQITGDSGAEQESHAERDADDTERFGAVFRLGHVGNVGLRDRQIACSQSIDDPGQEHHPQRVSEAKNQKANACADLTHKQDRPAADAVG